MESWVRKYAPVTPEDIVGQGEAVRLLDEFVGGYKQQKKKAALLYGPPGAGKTSTALAIAQKHGLELVEVNASDVRNAAGIKERIGSAMGQMSLFGGGKLILIDEVDGVSGTKDRGGVVELVKLLKKSVYPVICTANDGFSQKLKALKKEAVMVPFDPPTAADALVILQRICEKEGLVFEEAALKSLVRTTGGDLRGAINDLQGLAQMGEGITMDLIRSLDQRNKQDTIENALVKVLKSRDIDIARYAYDAIPEDFDKVMSWVDYNMPKEYTKPDDLVRAYEHLSRADVFKGRIRRWQHWRFLVHINAHLSAGIACAKDEKYPGMPKFEQSKRGLMIWMANMKYSKRKSIAEKIAQVTHTSTSQAIQSTLPYVQLMVKSGREDVVEYFDFSDDEVTWLKK